MTDVREGTAGGSAGAEGPNGDGRDGQRPGGQRPGGEGPGGKSPSGGGPGGQRPGGEGPGGQSPSGEGLSGERGGGIRRRLLRSPYAEIFRIPGAWRFSAAGLIGRMPMSMAGLGTVLLISAGTGHYGVAGAVSSASSLGTAVFAPQAGRLVDRHGQRTVLRPLVLAFALSAAILIAAVELHAPDWFLFLPAIAAGAAIPVLGSMVRARWTYLLDGSPRLHTAFSFESVGDEVVFVLGPAAVTLLATEVYPAAGLGVAVALCVAGTLWFAAQRATEPPLTPSRPGPGRAGSERAGSERAGAPGTPDGLAGPAGVAASAESAHPAEPSSGAGPQAPTRGAARPASGRRERRRAASASLIVLVPLYWCLGAMFVGVDLSTVGFAQHFGHKPLAGFILGTYALGSATGGFWYGSRPWRAPAALRFAFTLTCTVAGVATFWAQPNLISLTLTIYFCGLTIAPTLITGYSLVQAQARPGRGTEAMTWLSTGISVGVAAGSSVVGFIIDSHGPRWGYAFAACCGGAAVATCLLGLRRLRRPN